MRTHTTDSANYFRKTLDDPERLVLRRKLKIADDRKRQRGFAGLTNCIRPTADCVLMCRENLQSGRRSTQSICFGALLYIHLGGSWIFA